MSTWVYPATIKSKSNITEAFQKKAVLHSIKGQLNFKKKNKGGGGVKRSTFIVWYPAQGCSPDFTQVTPRLIHLFIPRTFSTPWRAYSHDKLEQYITPAVSDLRIYNTYSSTSAVAAIVKFAQKVTDLEYNKLTLFICRILCSSATVCQQSRVWHQVSINRYPDMYQYWWKVLRHRRSYSPNRRRWILDLLINHLCSALWVTHAVITLLHHSHLSLLVSWTRRLGKHECPVDLP